MHLSGCEITAQMLIKCEISVNISLNCHVKLLLTLYDLYINFHNFVIKSTLTIKNYRYENFNDHRPAVVFFFRPGRSDCQE